MVHTGKDGAIDPAASQLHVSGIYVTFVSVQFRLFHEKLRDPLMAYFLFLFVVVYERQVDCCR